MIKQRTHRIVFAFKHLDFWFWKTPQHQMSVTECTNHVIVTWPSAELLFWLRKVMCCKCLQMKTCKNCRGSLSFRNDLILQVTVYIGYFYSHSFKGIFIKLYLDVICTKITTVNQPNYFRPNYHSCHVLFALFYCQFRPWRSSWLLVL